MKINFFIIISIFVSLFFSPFIFDISLVNGKNSFYLFLFIIQIYFFLKYYLKINKFNFNSYLIFAILSVLSFGVNYWGAFPSLYFILILHFKKYKFVKINYLIIFFIIFISGIIVNFLLSPESIFSHIIDLDNIHGSENHQNQNLSLFFKVFFLKLLTIFKILNNTEYIFFPFIILLTFYLINNFKNKNLCLFLIILIFIPIILILISANVEPHIRYFSGVICTMLLIFSLMVNDILNNDTQCE